jgi:hypothetical protein
MHRLSVLSSVFIFAVSLSTFHAQSVYAADDASVLLEQISKEAENASAIGKKPEELAECWKRAVSAYNSLLKTAPSGGDVENAAELMIEIARIRAAVASFSEPPMHELVSLDLPMKSAASARLYLLRIRALNPNYVYTDLSAELTTEKIIEDLGNKFASTPAGAWAKWMPHVMKVADSKSFTPPRDYAAVLRKAEAAIPQMPDSIRTACREEFDVWRDLVIIESAVSVTLEECGKPEIFEFGRKEFGDAIKEWKLYRLPDGFIPDDYKTAEIPAKAEVIASGNASETPSLKKPKPGTYLFEGRGYGRVRKVIHVYNPDSTNLALLVREMSGTIEVVALDRRTGKPRPGVNLKFTADDLWDYYFETPGITDNEGAAVFTYPEDYFGSVMITVADGAENQSIEVPVSFSHLPERTYQSYFFSARPLYRPLDAVNFRGVLREWRGTECLTPAGRKFRVIIFCIEEGDDAPPAFSATLTADDYGTVSGNFSLSADAPLGEYRVKLFPIQIEDNENEFDVIGGREWLDSEYSNGIRLCEVREFRRPEFSVSAEPAKPYFSFGEKVTVAISGKYYYGAPLSGAAGKIRVYWKPAPSRERRDYYWYDWCYDDESDEYYDPEDKDLVWFEYGVKLDADGKAVLTIPTAGFENQGRDFKVALFGMFGDLGEENPILAGSFLYMRNPVVLTVSLVKPVLFEGDAAVLRVDAETPDEAPVSGRGIIRIFSPTAPENAGAFKEIPLEISSNGQGLANAGVLPPGDWRAEITVMLPGGNKCSEKFGFSVYGPGKTGLKRDDYLDGRLKLDRKIYHTGETIRAVVTVNREKAYGRLVLWGLKNYASTPFEIKGGAASVELKVPENVPSKLSLSADLYFGDCMAQLWEEVTIVDLSRQLFAEVKPDKSEYGPGEDAEFAIVVTHLDGAPAAEAAVTLGIIDDALFDLIKKQEKDIRAVINRPAEGFEYYEYNRYTAGMEQVEISSGKTYRHSAPVLCLDDDSEEEAEVAFCDTEEGTTLGSDRDVAIRSDFRMEAYWQSAVITDAKGRAVMRFKFPELLTRWRATCRVVEKGPGVGQSFVKTVTRKDLTITPGVPRFFRSGDDGLITFVVHNLQNVSDTVKVRCIADGIQLENSDSCVLKLEPGQSAAADFKFTVPAGGNSATITFTAIGAKSDDGWKKTFPILSRSLNVSSYSAIIGNKPLSVALPAEMENGAYLEISVTDSVAGVIRDAVPYLMEYPYGCVEQTMSRFLPALLARSACRRSGVPVENSDTLDKITAAGIKRLLDFQHADGGWGWWKNDQTNEWMTVYVVSGLVRAKSIGCEVDNEALTHALDFVEGEILSGSDNPAPLEIYAIEALARAGRTLQSEDMKRLLKEKSAIGNYGTLLLGLAFYAGGDNASALECLKHVLASSGGLEKGMMIVPGSGETRWDENEVVRTSLALSLASKLENKADAEKLAAGLMHLREAMIWNTTKDTAFAINGLADYSAFAEPKRRMSAVVALDGKTVAEPKERINRIVLGKSELAGKKELVITNRGVEGIYAGLSAHGFKLPLSDDVAARIDNSSFTIKREYYRIDIAGGTENRVQLDSPATVNIGDIIEVEMNVGSTGGYDYVILEDHKASGFEAVEEPKDDSSRPIDEQWWYFSGAHHEQRDDRAAFFFADFYSEEQTAKYRLTAQRPGRYAAPSARIYPMYSPSILSVTPAFHFIVLPPKPYENPQINVLAPMQAADLLMNSASTGEALAYLAVMQAGGREELVDSLERIFEFLEKLSENYWQRDDKVDWGDVKEQAQRVLVRIADPANKKHRIQVLKSSPGWLNSKSEREHLNEILLAAFPDILEDPGLLDYPSHYYTYQLVECDIFRTIPPEEIERKFLAPALKALEKHVDTQNGEALVVMISEIAKHAPHTMLADGQTLNFKLNAKVGKKLFEYLKKSDDFVFQNKSMEAIVSVIGYSAGENNPELAAVIADFVKFAESKLDGSDPVRTTALEIVGRSSKLNAGEKAALAKRMWPLYDCDTMAYSGAIQMLGNWSVPLGSKFLIERFNAIGLDSGPLSYRQAALVPVLAEIVPIWTREMLLKRARQTVASGKQLPFRRDDWNIPVDLLIKLLPDDPRLAELAENCSEIVEHFIKNPPTRARYTFEKFLASDEWYNYESKPRLRARYAVSSGRPVKISLKELMEHTNYLNDEKERRGFAAAAQILIASAEQHDLLAALRYEPGSNLIESLEGAISGRLKHESLSGLMGTLDTFSWNSHRAPMVMRAIKRLAEPGDYEAVKSEFADNSKHGDAEWLKKDWAVERRKIMLFYADMMISLNKADARGYFLNPDMKMPADARAAALCKLVTGPDDEIAAFLKRDFEGRISREIDTSAYCEVIYDVSAMSVKISISEILEKMLLASGPENAKTLLAEYVDRPNLKPIQQAVYGELKEYSPDEYKARLAADVNALVKSWDDNTAFLLMNLYEDLPGPDVRRFLDCIENAGVEIFAKSDASGFIFQIAYNSDGALFSETFRRAGVEGPYSVFWRHILKKRIKNGSPPESPEARAVWKKICLADGELAKPARAEWYIGTGEWLGGFIPDAEAENERISHLYREGKLRELRKISAGEGLISVAARKYLRSLGE